MARKIRARIERTKRVFVHNDIQNAAYIFAETIKEKQQNGGAGILIDGMACGIMIAFSFEANLNFIGFELHRAEKLPDWKERDLFYDKLKKVFGVLDIPIEWDKRPMKSVERMKRLRDGIAHGKPVYGKSDTVEVGTPEEIDIAAADSLAAGWQVDCNADVLFEAREDVDTLWKLMVEKSGLDLWNTMTSGEGGITYIEDVDPNTPSTVPPIK